MEMYCLHCGDCCRRLSPLTGDDEQCPHIVESNDYIFCKIYSNRPKECANHKFPTRFCPIGLDVLNINSPDQVVNRIDTGYERIKELGDE